MNATNPLNLPTQLPIARYRLSFTLHDNLILPPYAGSTLRGVFGHALRRAACMTRQKDCTGCPLSATCPYTRIFATPQTTQLSNSQQQTPPQPYIIEAPEDGMTHYPAGSSYTFNLVLFGQTLMQLPLIAYAFDLAFQQGIGRAQARGTLTDIAVQTNGSWHSILEQQKIQPHTNQLSLPENYPQRPIVHIHTPMRIISQKQIIKPDTLSSRILFQQMLRRTTTFAALHFSAPVSNIDFQPLLREAETISATHTLQWQDWTRYSNRQQQAITLGGITGSWQPDDFLPPAFAQLLYLAQWLHIGKETVFGLGRITLSEQAV